MEGFSLTTGEISRYLEVTPPFLMIDYVTKVIPGKMANGYKNFTNNEWFFPIHFPGHPNVPGALQLEALAQMLTVAITTLPGNKGRVTHAISHTVKFKREIFKKRIKFMKKKRTSHILEFKRKPFLELLKNKNS